MIPQRRSVGRLFARSMGQWSVLTVVLVLAGVFLFRETRGTSFGADEWTWIVQRRGNDLGTFLRPHNGHLSLVPIVIYRVLFATFGLSDYVPYRVMVTVAHLICVVLVFVYASRRLVLWWGLIPSILILFFAGGWPEILQPFQVAWLISLGAGLGALLMLDRGGRGGQPVACGLLGVSLASSSIGVAVALGLTVEVLWQRRSLRGAWVVAGPLAFYAAWRLHYDDSTFSLGLIFDVPRYAGDSAASAFSGLVGLKGFAELAGLPDTSALGWGRPLALIALVLLGWRLTRLERSPLRVVTLLVMALSFWALTTLSRATISPPTTSRYLYVSAFFIVLGAIELTRGLAVSRPLAPLLAAAACAAVLSNIGGFRVIGPSLRGEGRLSTARLEAMQLARAVIKSDFVSAAFPSPYLSLTAADYFSAIRAYGSPAASPAQIASGSVAVRLAADVELVRAGEIRLVRLQSAPLLGNRPQVSTVSGGIVRNQGPCIVFSPNNVKQTTGMRELQLTVPDEGLRLQAIGGPASLGIRRFVEAYQRLGQVAVASPVVLRIVSDEDRRAWHARLRPSQGAKVCGLGNQ